MRSLKILLVAVLALTTVAGHGGFHPQFNNERVYVHCPEQATTTKANVPKAPLSWNKKAPTASVQDGAGCGNGDVGEFFRDFEPSGQTGIVYKGTHSGNLDRLTVRAWVLGSAYAEATGSLIMDFELRIGNKVILSQKDVTVAAKASDTGASHELVFSITDIGLTRKADLKKHNVELALGISSPASGAVAFVADTTEVPSGIHFSPKKLAATKFSAK